MRQNVLKVQTPFLFFNRRPEKKNLPIISFTPMSLASNYIIEYNINFTIYHAEPPFFSSPGGQNTKPSNHIIHSMSYSFT